MYQRKTRDIFIIEQYTGPKHGREDVCCEDTLNEAKKEEMNTEKISRGIRRESERRGRGYKMDSVDCRVIHEEDFNEMQRHTGRLQGRIREVRRERDILFVLFVITAMALAYVLANSAV